MMGLAVLDARLERPGWLDQRAFTQTLKTAFAEVGLHWATKILKKHFTAAGAREYNYTLRRPEYMLRKLRKYGHQDPFVLGPKAELKNRLLSRAGFRISATSKGVTITLKTGSGLLYKHYARELTAVSTRDRRRLRIHLLNAVKRRLALYTSVVEILRR